MKKIIIISSILVIAAALIVWQLITTQTSDPLLGLSDGTNLNSGVTTTPEIVVDVTPDTNPLPPYKGDPIDNIGTDLSINQVPPEYHQKYTAELAAFKESLSRNPADADAWVRVGVLKKVFNNYIGARDAWEYAKIVNPRYSTPYYNLGDLYGWYLKDFPKAEENYLKAIEIDPTLTYLYISLAEFYNVVYKAKSAQAIEVIRRGLKALPDDADLKRALDYYASR